MHSKIIVLQSYFRVIITEQKTKVTLEISHGDQVSGLITWSYKNKILIRLIIFTQIDDQTYDINIFRGGGHRHVFNSI